MIDVGLPGENKRADRFARTEQNGVVDGVPHRYSFL